MADLGVLGPIGAGVDIASSLASTLDSVFGWSAKRQHRMQKDLMNTQQDQWKEQQKILADQQLDQWNRENEYNDPTNYYNRLLNGADANGISKQALFAGSNGSVGVASSKNVAGSTSMTGAGGSTLLPFGSSNILGAMRQRAEISNIEADSALKRAQAGESASHSTLMDRQSDLVVANERLVNNQALSEQSKRALLDAQATMEQLRADNYQNVTDAQLEEIYSRVNNLNINTSNAEKEGKYIEENARVQLQRTKSEIALNGVLCIVNKALAKKYGTETTGVAFDNALKREQNSLIVEKLQKELQYFDFNQLKFIFEKPQAWIMGLANGKASLNNQLDRLIHELYNSLSTDF